MRILILVVVNVLLVSSGFAHAGDVDDEGRGFVEEKCSLCHPPDYALGSRSTAEGWRATVMRMREDNGADLTDRETEMIINYLVKYRSR